ncbi:restriction endonuclease subunit S [Shewanella sp. GD04112]|uniref:restriction endonuclease subunit S n=1 Tax=Shewanella sp. GD04112 TaxID=2975434 RepID=UPI00244C9DA0|nr:restriction endonuclease subunit S [Shewanella sp. GD04112]MDH0448437.1 restriction endonuclease subunit S [Shewanella sp. GD04112]
MTNLSGINLNNGTAVGAKREGMDSPSQSLALMPKYDDYVDSGVEWLGRVPASWELTRLGTRFNERRSKVSDIDYPALSVTKKGVLPQLDNAAKTKDGDNRKLVKEGDFVINSRSDRKGSSGVSDRDGSVSLINIVLKPKGIHPKFSEHLLKSHAFIEEYYRVGRGIVADLWTTRYDEMRTITISVPSLEEQTRIANFLDKKTAQIDDAIAIKEQQISLLKERKQIIIQQAVTQGLDPNVPMKDSGVDWIGKIPAHWGLMSLRYAFEFLNSRRVPISAVERESRQGEYPYYGASGVIDYVDDYIFDEDLILIAEDGANLLSKSTPLAFVATGKYWVNNHAHIIKPKFHGFKYWAELLSGLDYTVFISGAAQPKLTRDRLASVLVPVPPKDEIQEIISFIEGIEPDLNRTIDIQKSQIEKLKEYKTTLINSAVTGKIKITPEMFEQ